MRTLFAAAIAMLLASCTGGLPLDNRPCPCADGYTCCTLTNTCVKPGATCAFDLAPSDTHVRMGGTQSFTASVPVTWSVDENRGGSIDADGTYHAPMHPGTYHLRAATPTGMAATTSVVVGPSELLHLLGTPGGTGTIDGTGSVARLDNPTSIVGDDKFLYVSVSGDVGAAYSCLNDCSEAGPLVGPCMTQHCPGLFAPGVRRISRASGDVTWLVKQHFFGSLAIAGATLFGAIDDDVKAAVTMIGYLLSSAPRVIVEIDSDTGKLTPFAGANAKDEPRDGVGQTARFGDITGMVGDAHALYVTDGLLLRRIDVATGAVTTLMAPASWSGTPVTTTSNGTLGALALYNDSLYVVDTENPKQASGGQSQETVWQYELATGKARRFGLGPPGGFGAMCLSAVAGNVLLVGNAVFSGTQLEFGAETDAGYEDGFGDSARFSSPAGVWCAADGWVYVADTGNSVIREIPPFGPVGTLAGAAPGQGTDTTGPYMHLLDARALSSNAAGDVAVSAPLAVVRADAPSAARQYHIADEQFASDPFPGSIAMGSDNKLYYADNGIDELDLATNAVSPLFGFGGGVSTGDLAFDGVRWLYFTADSDGVHEGGLFRIDPTNGDSELILPRIDGYRWLSPIAVDGTRRVFGALEGDLVGEYELESLDLSTRQLTPLPTPPDGWQPTALAYDPSGILYVAEKDRQRVRGLVVDTGEVFDLVGKPGERGLRTGPLATARLNAPTALAILPNGGLAIADGEENTVVVVR